MDTRVAEAERRHWRGAYRGTAAVRPEEARARLESWLADISETAGRIEAPATSGRLSRGEFTDHRHRGGSPYLWELARADPGRLLALLESDPNIRFAAILAETTRAIAPSPRMAR